jgi:hypothetical protein
MREYLMNVDFDLSLRRGRAAETSDGRARQAVEMPHHLLLLGVEGDSVLVDEKPDESFLAYLERRGIPRPSTTVLPAITPEASFTPFGWNDKAVDFNRAYTRPARHPHIHRSTWFVASTVGVSRR